MLNLGEMSTNLRKIPNPIEKIQISCWSVVTFFIYTLAYSGSTCFKDSPPEHIQLVGSKLVKQIFKKICICIFTTLMFCNILLSGMLHNI